MRERDLYRPICDWLAEFLRRKYRSACSIWAEDTSRSSVAEFLRRHRLTTYVPWWVTLEIPTDITGAALIVTCQYHRLRLAIVEVKTHPINLRDLSQALGYAKVVKPDHAFLISPNGWAENLQRLVWDYGRTDVLEYAPKHYLVIARWDVASNSVRQGEVLLPHKI